MEEKNDTDKLNLEIVKASVLTRCGIFVVDLFIVVLITLIFQTWIIAPIGSNITNYSEKMQLYRETLISSHLYGYGEENIEQIDKLFDFEKNSVSDYIAYLDEKITKFYSTFEGMNINDYLNNKKESGLFNIDENNNYTTKPTILETTYKEFYEDQLLIAISQLNKNDLVLDLSRFNTIFTIITIVSSASISLIIFYLIIPLLFKNGETLGKKLLSVGLVSAKDGFRVKKSQIIIRFLSFYLLEVVLSIFTIGIPLIISFSLMFFTKKGTALHDYLSATICVDKKQSVIYKDYDEFIKHEELLMNN